MDEAKQPEEFTLVSEVIGGLPIINNVIERLRLAELLAQALPAAGGRVKLAPAVLLRLVISNLALGREPLYGLGEWAARFEPALLGLRRDEVAAVNDDRAGRALDALFDADRGSLLTTVVLRAIREFGVDTHQLHNDSTSISVQGLFRGADGTPRGGKTTPVVTFGHSKDHRPDLKQLVWILTVSSDGAVPILYRLANGNTSDVATHVATWDGLAELLGRSDFLYVADSKLCSREAMGHISGHGGRFVTVLPAFRAEDKAFRKHLQRHTPDWEQAMVRPGRHEGDAAEVYSVAPAPAPSAEGYRIVWVHSTAKASHDATIRQARTQAGTAAIEALEAKFSGPRCRTKTRPAAEKAVATALAKAHAEQWVTAKITERIQTSSQQLGRGRPGPGTRYKEITTSHFSVTATINAEHISYDAASDGCFPLITNDRLLSNTEVLAAYKYQPHLERRHHLLKSVQHAAPVLLRNPARIEAMFCCQFLALLICALIEREARNGMREAQTPKIALYPEARDCTAPSTERILEIFQTTSRHHLYRNGTLIQTFAPQLTNQQQQILGILGMTPTNYTKQKQQP
jgi:transposase